ncbi:MAG: pteridine reductase [Gammaproteobacteria bacterium]|nr:MAG: pteridine reductase [Gammaproteobacteria bacterium]
MAERRPIALVTGGAVRVGAAISRCLHADGFDVALHYRRSRQPAEELAAELNDVRADSAFLVSGDLAETDGPQAIAAGFLDRSAACDLLVNNASSFFPTAVDEADDAAWDELFGSNLRGPFFLIQALLPALQAGQGAIVNLVDIHAERPLAGYPVYSMAKAGLAMLTRSLARELAPGIRVNGVAPGAILWPEDPDDAWGREQEAILKRVPLGRTGTPEDIAGAVLYLARAPYVTGQILAVDGGRSVVI